MFGLVARTPWRYVINGLVEGGVIDLIAHVQPSKNSSLPSPSSSPPSNVLMTCDEIVVDSTEVSEVMSPQVSLEMMGPSGVQDLPRYHSLVEDFQGFADRYMAAGRLRGPGAPYLLEMAIPLSGENGDFLLGQMDRAEDDKGEEW